MSTDTEAARSAKAWEAARAAALKPTKYGVTLWGSHPDQDNDDCWTYYGMDNLDEALAAFNDINSWCSLSDLYITQWIVLDGDDGTYKERRNPSYKKRADNDDDWRRERAMQAGMAFGCAGYNDEMGAA